MSSQTRRIPPNEWEERKGDILNFISQKGYTLKKMKDVMKTEHGFDARYELVPFTRLRVDKYLAYHNTKHSFASGNFARTSLKMNGQL